MIKTTIESVAQFVGTTSGVGVASIGLASTSENGSSIISEGTMIPLALFVGGIIFSVTLTWRTASTKASLERRLDKIEFRLDNMEKDE